MIQVFLQNERSLEIKKHQFDDIAIAEIQSDGNLIKTASEGLNLLGNVYYQGFDGMILYEKNLPDNFFDLKTGLAGEVLQKFSNYRMRLVIVGDFSNLRSQSLKDFIRESNGGSQVNFVETLQEALARVSS